VHDLKQSMFLIPDVVFAEFIRYSSASSGVAVAPPERTTSPPRSVPGTEQERLTGWLANRSVFFQSERTGAGDVGTRAVGGGE
jgi:hypothetical protein